MSHHHPNTKTDKIIKMDKRESSPPPPTQDCKPLSPVVTTTPTGITTCGNNTSAYIIEIGGEQKVKFLPVTNILQGALLGEKVGGMMMQTYQQYDDNPVLSRHSTEELRSLLAQKYLTRHPYEKEESLRRRNTFFRDILFDFILHVPIIIDGYSVKRKNWAKAFYESDVIQSAKCLFEDLFSQEEMSTCTLNGKAGTKELSAIKMLAILRASCWMKNKNQDPYSFNPADPSHNVHPSKDEQDKIEKKVFTERRSQANRKITKKKPPLNSDSPAMKRSPREPDSDSQHSEIMGDNQDNESVKSEGSLSDGNVKGVHKTLEDQLNSQKQPMGELEQLYYRFPDDFLDAYAPDREDIFIDGILIPRKDWYEAYEEAKKDTIKAAWILFKNLFSEKEIMNCTLNGKNGTTELCPVRKLAIIRAVQWMSKSNLDGDRAFEFDSDDDNCNLFPTEEDKERIETKVFTEKRYQQSRQLTSKVTFPNKVCS